VSDSVHLEPTGRIWGVIVIVVCVIFGRINLHAQTVTVTPFYQFPDLVDQLPSSVIEASDGNFYVASQTLYFQGSEEYSTGVIYQVSPSASGSVIYSFTPAQDYAQSSRLIEGGDGNLYATTYEAGNLSDCVYSSLPGSLTGCGQVFRLSTQGAFTDLHSFDQSDGAGPSPLIPASDGKFYGVTNWGGNIDLCDYSSDAIGCGTLFNISPDGTFTTLYEFSGPDGSDPSGLVQGSDGNFYGGTGIGGTSTGAFGGTIFKITPGGSLTTIYNFSGTGLDGDGPTALVEGKDGNFYGATVQGGTYNQGTIFRVTPQGEFTTLYSFTGGTDGGVIQDGLSVGGDGNFYGVAYVGGLIGGCGGPGCGTIFRVTPSGTLTTLFIFQEYAIGSNPFYAPRQASNGDFYGTTDANGFIYQMALKPSVPAPVQLMLNQSSIVLKQSVQLNWKVLNAFSLTMQQCYAFVQGGASGAGTWTGLQSGSLSGGIYAGSATITPTAEGTYTYALSCGGIESGFATLTVGAAAPLTITMTGLSSGTVGVSYTATLMATGGVAPYVWSIASGSLPPGLALASSMGVISGTPTAAGTDNFVVEVTDSESTPMTATASLGITIAAAAAPAVTANPTLVTVAAPGQSGTTTLTVTKFASSAFAFACSGLPSGAVCNFSTLSGTGALGTVVMTVATAAPSVVGRTGTLTGMAVPGLVCLAGLFLTRRRRAELRGMFVMLMALAACAVVSGCGGGGGVGGGSGTPVGTSSVTVTASAGGQSAMTVVTLNVQ
jgi:uncharacterized repeat protein (TIGR03803 family)